MRREANNRRKQCGIFNHFCELSFIARRPALHTQNLPRKPCGFPSFFFESSFAPQNLPRKPWSSFFVRRPSHEEPSQRTILASHIFWVNHATFTPRPFAENHVAFQVFLRTPSHPKPSQKTTWRFTLFCKATFPPRTYPQKPCGVSFFLCVDLRTKNLPRKPCGVSTLFLWVDLCTKNLPRKPCGVPSFFCESTVAPKTFPENHVAGKVCRTATGASLF